MTVALRNDEVSNRALREAFLRLNRNEGLTAALLAERLGWLHGDRPDDKRVRRMLGLTEETSRGHRYRQARIRWDSVGPICRAMDLLPAELGY